MSDKFTVRSISSVVRVPMSMRQQAAMSRLDVEDFTGLVRLARKELSKQGVTLPDEYCERAIVALKQYYALTIFDPRNMHAVSDILDPFWHAHILDTVRYQMLCTGIGGFMHHDPLDMENGAKVEAVAQVYEYTRQVLRQIFGDDNLDSEFHPHTLPDIKLVCLHDIDDDGVQNADVFPENPRCVSLRRAYGHRGQREAIVAGLRAKAA